MITSAPVTRKGQFTLPKELRDKYSINTRVFIEDTGFGVNLTSFPSIFEIAGTVKRQAHANESVLKAREAMEKTYKRF